MSIIKTIKNKNTECLHSAKVLTLITLVFIRKSRLGFEFEHPPTHAQRNTHKKNIIVINHDNCNKL